MANIQDNVGSSRPEYCILDCSRHYIQHTWYLGEFVMEMLVHVHVLVNAQ